MYIAEFKCPSSTTLQDKADAVERVLEQLSLKQCGCAGGVFACLRQRCLASAAAGRCRGVQLHQAGSGAEKTPASRRP
jgi:hypothetical protein